MLLTFCLAACPLSGTGEGILSAMLALLVGSTTARIIYMD
jgi:hypothetical protein